MFDGIEFAKELPQQIKDYREFQKDLHHNGTYLLTTNFRYFPQNKNQIA
jgi:hypothetical protein